ncbi:hypothetical protein GCM10025734_82980 [Kitasatospora paranensis]
MVVEQVAVAAGGGDLAVDQVDHRVGLVEQERGDAGDEGGPSGSGAAEPGGHRGFGVGVDGGGRFDGEQHLGVGGERAG